MSPDSVESRLQRLETGYAALNQRVLDLADRVVEQFRSLDQDIRALGPLVREVDKISSDLTRFREAQQGLQAKVDALHVRMDKRETDEIEARREREKETRASRRQLYVGMALVLASSFGAFFVQIIHVAPH